MQESWTSSSALEGWLTETPGKRNRLNSFIDLTKLVFVICEIFLVPATQALESCQSRSMMKNRFITSKESSHMVQILVASKEFRQYTPK